MAASFFLEIKITSAGLQFSSAMIVLSTFAVMEEITATMGTSMHDGSWAWCMHMSIGTGIGEDVVVISSSLLYPYCPLVLPSYCPAVRLSYWETISLGPLLAAA